MMQSCASAARLLGGGSILQKRHKGQGGHRLTATSDRVGAAPARPMGAKLWSIKLLSLKLLVGRFSGRLQHDAGGQLAGRHVAPQCDQKLAGKRHDHGLAGACAAVGGA
jgi:hypothetical protein